MPLGPNNLDLRATVPAGKRALRSRITDEILAVLSAALFDPDEPDAGLLFSVCKMGNLEDIAVRETPGCALEEGDEEVTELLYEVNDKTMRLFVNFKVVKVKGIDQQDLINYYFARIVQLLVTTHAHSVELANDIREAGNSIQTNGSYDPEPGGIVSLDVDYRHARGDPLEPA